MAHALDRMALLSSTPASFPPKTGQAATAANFMPEITASMPKPPCHYLVGRVEALGRRSDQLEILRVLERDVAGTGSLAAASNRAP